MKKRLVATMLVLTMALSLMACGKKDGEVEESPTVEEGELSGSEEIEVEAVDDSAAFFDQKSEDGKVRSYLNGEWVDEKYGRQRPVAVMIENTKACLPQYGIGNAGVIYECVVEGGITRMRASDVTNLIKSRVIIENSHHTCDTTFNYTLINNTSISDTILW